MIAETHRLMPTKPIRYLVNTHHHFDHAGGLREVGRTTRIVITQEANFTFYEGIVFDLRPRMGQPDCLSFAPRQVHYALVKEGYELTDGEQHIDIYTCRSALNMPRTC